ncbi:hypothetical protein E2320_006382, partial [Naja naja]
MSGVAGSKTLLATGCSSSLDKMPLAGSPVRKATMHRYISTKVLLAEGRETPFTDHCRDYENTYRLGHHGPAAETPRGLQKQDENEGRDPLRPHGSHQGRRPGDAAPFAL